MPSPSLPSCPSCSSCPRFLGNASIPRPVRESAAFSSWALMGDSIWSRERPGSEVQPSSPHDGVHRERPRKSRRAWTRRRLNPRPERVHGPQRTPLPLAGPPRLRASRLLGLVRSLRVPAGSAYFPPLPRSVAAPKCLCDPRHFPRQRAALAEQPSTLFFGVTAISPPRRATLDRPFPPPSTGTAEGGCSACSG
jgi:hypothetical protein